MDSSTDAIDQTNPDQDSPKSPYLSMRYEDKVLKAKRPPFASCEVSISGHVARRFIRKDFHLVNLTFNFLRHAQRSGKNADGYAQRMQTLVTMLAELEQSAAMWTKACDEAIASTTHIDAPVPICQFRVMLLNAQSAKLLTAIERVDRVLALCRVLVIRQLMQEANFQALRTRFMDLLEAIRAAAITKPDAAIAP